MTLVTTSPVRRLAFRSREIQGVHILESPALLPMPFRCGFDPFDTWRRLRFLGKRNFHVVHAFDCRPSVIHPALSLCRRSGAPLFIDWADWWTRGGAATERREFGLLSRLASPLETFYEEAFRCRARGQTVICQALERRAISLGFPSQRVLRLPSGADVDTIRPLDRAAARTRLGIDPSRRTTVFVGYAPYDMELLLESHALLLKRYPDLLLVLVGEFPRSIRKMIRRVAPEHSVLCTGPIPYRDIGVHLGAADVLLLPYVDRLTNRGRWPNKIGDYLAAGRPVVTHPTGDFAEFFSGCEFVVMATDTAAGFAAAVAGVLADPAKIEVLGRSALGFAEQELCWGRLAEALERFYVSVGSAQGLFPAAATSS